MEPTFKAAERSDMEVLLELRRAFCRHEHLAFDDRRDRVALEVLIGDASLGRVWLICLGGEVVGYVVLTFSYSLEFHGRDAYVDEIYVREAHRGRGVGGQTLRFIEKVCRALGVQALHLEVDRDNTSARAVYETAGFEDRNNYLLTRRIAHEGPEAAR